MPETTPNLDLPYILPGQAQKHVTHNEALQILDACVQLCLEAVGTNTPPTAPSEGQVWGIGEVPTGVWTAKARRLAVFANNGWLFVQPEAGWIAWDRESASVRVWQNNMWESLPLANLEGLGIGTTYDATNRLSVVAPATLLSHDGAGHQLKINKAAPSDTASLLFQTNWSGRAEMGLSGNDSFGVKVSADGTNWLNALMTVPATGQVSVPSGLLVADGTAAVPGVGFETDPNTGLFRPAADQLGVTAGGTQRVLISATTMQVSVPVTGTAVVQSATDVTSGRLLTTGAGAAQAYRRANILGTVTQSAGVPTGALLERGGNANGQYVRYADGTQICWNIPPAQTCTVAIGSMFTNGADLTWTFPAAFSVTPNCMGNGGDLYRSVGGYSSSTVFTYRIKNPVSATTAVFPHLLAIGRWF